MKAEGRNGFIEVRGDSLVLTRKRFFGKGKGEKQIKISAITSIQIRPASFALAGYFQIGYSGSSESKGGLMDAAKDENTILFLKNQQPDFETIRDMVNQMQSARAAPAKNSDDLAGQLKAIADLHHAGVLSDEEFATAKERLLK